MEQKTKQKEDSGKSNPNEIKGDDVDLAAAIADTSEVKDGEKITFKGSDEKEKKSPVKKKAKNTEEKRKSSGIMDTYLKMQEGEDSEDNESEDSENEEESDTSSDQVDIEGYEEVDINIPTSKTIKEKFQRFKENEKLLKTEAEKAKSESIKLQERLKDSEKRIQEAVDSGSQSTEITENEEYKKLQKKLQDATETIERLRIEESPRFQEKFDKRIKDTVKKSQPFIKSIPDQEKRDATINALDAAANIPPGDENDPAFYEVVNRITSQDGLPDHIKTPLYSKMMELRQAVNERAEAVKNWKSEKESYQSEEVNQKSDIIKQANTALKAIRVRYEEENKERIDAYRKNKEVFGYDETVSPYNQALESEVEKTVSLGAPTPGLLQLASYGSEFIFQMKQNQQLGKLLKDQQDKIKDLEKKVKKFSDGGTSGGKGGSSGSKKSSSDTSSYEKGSGILQTMKELESKK